MTLEHIIYIPGVLLVGLTVGYLLGAKAVRKEVASVKKRLRR